MPPGDSAGAAQLRRSLEAVEREALEAGDMRAVRLARVAHGLASLAYHWHIRQEQAERRERRLWMAIGVLTGAVVALALTAGS